MSLSLIRACCFFFGCLATGCFLGDLDLSSKSCPCALGFTCVESKCVPGEGDAGQPVSDAAELDTPFDSPVGLDGSTDIGGEDSTDASVSADARDVGVDSATPDAGPLFCTLEAEPATVLLFAFDEAVFPQRDVTGAFSATVRAPAPVATPGRCGGAVRWDGAGVAEVADGPALDLASGSYEVWVRRSPGPHPSEGILSRDAINRALPGHFALFWTSDDRVVARHQTTATSINRCSPPGNPVDSWVHVGVNFGSPNLELWVDGVIVDAGGIFTHPVGGPDSCGPGRVFNGGLAGNNNPLVFGADTGGSDEGVSTPLRAFFHGAVDRFELRSERRDFSFAR